MKRSQLSLFVAAAVIVPTLAYGSEVEQRWAVTVGSVDSTPCENAGISLELRDSAGDVVSTYAVPLALNPLGVRTSSWTLRVPRSGDYTLAALDHGCSDESRTVTVIPVEVSDRVIPDQLILVATGNKSRWRVYYFGVTRRLLGRGILGFDDDMLQLTNVSDRPIRTCGLMLGSPVRELKLIGGEWQEGNQYEYKGQHRTLAPGEAIRLVSPKVRVISVDKDEADTVEPPPTSAMLVEAKTAPPAGTFRYIGKPPHGSTNEPFPGHCDTYVLEVDIPSDDN